MDQEPGFDPMSWAIVDDKVRGVFRVNRRAFVDPGVLDMERRAIFERCWLYLGHESEVAEPGRFIARSVGGRPLLFNRDRNGKLHVFYNTCMHRGATVCREPAGRARNFTCAYHGWVYGDDGRLVDQPLSDSYAPACNAAGELHLRRVAKFASYCGFVFVNFDAGAGSLEDYLAGAREYLELVSLQCEAGMEIVGGTQTYCAKANWKLLQENSADGYHANTTHSTYMDYLKSREGADAPNVNVYAGRSFGRARDLGNGHAVSESVNGTPWGRPRARWVSSWSPHLKVELDAIYDRMVARLGEEKATVICRGDRNLLIFPNLVVNDIMALTVRTFYPLAPNYYEASAWALAPKEEPAEIRDLRMRNFVEFLGPGGFATPDDQEMLELCQKGYAAVGGAEWNDISRGMLLEDGTEPGKQDELQMRAFWRQWKRRLSARAGAAA